MIITRTPFRISFVGGGSDISSFYKHHPGAILSTTINKYMYISSHKYFEPEKLRVKYSETETVDAIEEIKHPIFREAFKQFGIKGGIEFSSIADVPSGTGMGSSSSFTVGLLQNIYCTKNIHVLKEELAQAACNLEIGKLKEPIGKQDQYATSYGGLNIIRFNSDESVSVERVCLSGDQKKRIEENLILFYTGYQRKANQILSEQKNNMSKSNKFDVIKEMTVLVDELKEAMMLEDLQKFGKLLHRNWELKKTLADKITNAVIEDAYHVALKNGAFGGKLLGAGGGGFLLFVCPPEKQHHLTQVLGLRKLDFKFEDEGSKVIYFANEER